MNNETVIVNPEWITAAQELLNKKNYLIFRDILDDVVCYKKIPLKYNPDTKAYKLFKAMRIEDDIFNQYVDEFLDKPIDTGLAEKAKARYTK